MSDAVTPRRSFAQRHSTKQLVLNASMSATPAALTEVMVVNPTPVAQQAMVATLPVESDLSTTTDTVTPPEDDDTIKRETWVMQQAEQKFAIQVGSSADLKFLQRFARQLPTDSPRFIYHYKYTGRQQPEYGLAIGLFDNRNSADKAADNLPEKHRRYGPWVRRVGDIKRSVIVN